jgi:hypothetical protein
VVTAELASAVLNRASDAKESEVEADVANAAEEKHSAEDTRNIKLIPR